ncbi:SIR2 family protein [Vibrio alginolyticus]|nr:SIR2 family protein [Vibrio alginolyticus]
MITWPENLKKEVARRRAVFFIGSGVSASASSENGSKLPTWPDFLTGCLDLIHDDNHRENITELIEKKNYLTALQGIYNFTDKSDYLDHLRSCFLKNDFVNFPLHEIIFDLDLRVVITTNFDKIYENYCNQFSKDGYTVLNYDNKNLGDIIRSDERLIIKAHGCINSPKDIIFTRSQYHKAKKDHPWFYELLKAIFLTHTCVFIGCGMEDPDILLALEDVKITSSSEKPHYFLTLKNSLNPIYETELLETYNTKALEYEPNHQALERSLMALREEVQALREVNV